MVSRGHSVTDMRKRQASTATLANLALSPSKELIETITSHKQGGQYDPGLHHHWPTVSQADDDESAVWNKVIEFRVGTASFVD